MSAGRKDVYSKYLAGATEYNTFNRVVRNGEFPSVSLVVDLTTFVCHSEGMPSRGTWTVLRSRPVETL